MQQLDELFKTALEARDSGDFALAVEHLKTIASTFGNHEKIYVVYVVLAGVYKDLKDYSNSLKSFQKALEFHPGSEISSLGTYLSLMELNRDKEALEEMIRYLGKYPANIYKDTLKELLEDINSGELKIFMEEIRELAVKNNVA